MNEQAHRNAVAVARFGEAKPGSAAPATPPEGNGQEGGSRLGMWLGWLLLLAPVGLALGVRPLLRALEHTHLLLILASMVTVALVIITAGVARNYRDDRLELGLPKRRGGTPEGNPVPRHSVRAVRGR
jgi:hypothetical protein